MIFLLSFVTVLCNFENLRSEFTEVLVFENIVNNQLSYTNMLRQNQPEGLKKSSAFYGADLKKGIIIHTVDKDLFERRLICIDKNNLNKTPIYAFAPEMRSKINDKNVSVYYPPIISLHSEDKKILAVRSDFNEKELPQLIYSTKLFERIFIDKEKTKKLISKIISDISDKSGIYTQLFTGEYILLYFNHDFTIIKEFFDFFAQKINGNNLTNIFNELFKESYLKNEKSVLKVDEESYPMSCMYIDISNILSLAENHDYIFEILNTDHKNTKLTGKVCLLVESKNRYNLHSENISIFDDNDKKIICTEIFNDENSIKILLDLSECYKSKMFSVRIEFRNEFSLLNDLTVDLKPFLKNCNFSN